MKTAVLINRKGQEEARLLLRDDTYQIIHDGRVWGFGVAKLDGDWHFYDMTPENPPMGDPFEQEEPERRQEPVLDNPGYRPCDCEDYPCCGH